MYKINVLTIQNHTLTFRVDSYTIGEGEFVEFTDKKTGINKKFHSSKCEIEEIGDVE